jgi:hypothetical protein
MNRTLFFEKVKIDGVEEYDFLEPGYHDFEIKRSPVYYRLDSIDRKRPDIISYKNYGTVDYWWIILLVNSLDNPFTDTAIGTITMIPNIYDIHDFYSEFKLT